MIELLPGIYGATGLIRVAGPYRVKGSMFILRDGQDLVLMDPFLLSDQETREMEALGRPSVILIAGEMHVRDTGAYRKRYGARVLAHRDAMSRLDVAVDHFFEDGEALPAGLTAIGMPGTFRGETVFRREGGVLLSGDALFNIQPEDHGLMMKMLGFPRHLGAMPRLFMDNRKRADASYRRLLEHDFDKILVSHGAPILSDGKERLRAALNLEP